MISIKMYRGRANLTQQELADRIGVERSYLSLLESPNYHLVPKTNVLKLSEVLGCSPVELYGLDNLKIKPSNDKETKQLILILYKTLKETDKNDIIQKMEELKGKS